MVFMVEKEDVTKSDARRRLLFKKVSKTLQPV